MATWRRCRPTSRRCEPLLNAFAVPPRLEAELYGVLVSLPGVGFDPSVRDGAGRQGVGLYIIQKGWEKLEVIVNPRSYQYMGFTDVAVQAHTDSCTGTCWPKVTHYSKDQILNWDAQFAEGIVQKAGQVPGR